MTWCILDASGLQGEFRYKRGHVQVVPEDGESQLINLQEIQTIVVGQKVSLSGGLLAKLAELGIPLLVVDWRYIPVASSLGWSAHTRVGARQAAQAEMSLPRKKSAWSSIIRAKIMHQGAVLHAQGSEEESKYLQGVAKAVRSGDPENREGLAARFYWSHLGFGNGFVRRQDGGDAYNAALNYGYTILRGAGIRAVVQAGLWPALGVFHHNRANAFCLVDDLMEPFRPAIDYTVASLPQDFDLADPRTRKALAAALQQPFDSAGRALDTCFFDFARAYGMYVEGETSKLSVPKWTVPVDSDGQD